VLGWLGFAHAQGRPAFNQIQTTSSAKSLPFNVRQFLSYVWQFYLPRFPGLTPFRTTPDLPIYDVWLKEGWGVFGWLELSMPGWVYAVLSVITGSVAVASAAIVARFRDRLRLELLTFFAVAVLSLLFGLHFEEYRSIIAHQGALLQGRYLLPLVGLFGLAVGLIVSRIPPRWRGAACGAVIMGLLLLQLLALAAVARRYYT
jgi:hypothetical protein